MWIWKSYKSSWLFALNSQAINMPVILASLVRSTAKLCVLGQNRHQLWKRQHSRKHVRFSKKRSNTGSAKTLPAYMCMFCSNNPIIIFIHCRPKTEDSSSATLEICFCTLLVRREQNISQMPLTADRHELCHKAGVQTSVWQQERCHKTRFHCSLQRHWAETTKGLQHWRRQKST